MEGKRKLVTTYNDDDGGGRCTGFGDAGITLQGETVVGVIHFGDHGHVGFVGGTDKVGGGQRPHDAHEHRRYKLHDGLMTPSSTSSIGCWLLVAAFDTQIKTEKKRILVVDLKSKLK